MISGSTLRYLVLVLLCLSLPACKKRPAGVTRSVYYWKTGFEIGHYQQQRLEALRCARMYVRLFDVDWDAARQEPLPVGTLRWKQQPDKERQYVPVVYVTQRTLTTMHPQQMPALAVNMGRLIEGLCAQAQIAPSEIQIDCDWTAGTKDVYFSLLRALRAQAYFKGKTLSCTIRLHQVKYTTRNGIPPADRGLLMCYNMGDMRKPGDHNSILDATEAKAYLERLEDYPLPLDVALPLFSQCLLFRNDILQGILRDVRPEDVKEHVLFSREKERLYRVLADSNWNGFDLRKNDIIRVEEPLLEDIRSVARYAAGRLRNDTFALALFDCDSITLSKYSDHDLETIYNAGF